MSDDLRRRDATMNELEIDRYWNTLLRPGPGPERADLDAETAGQIDHLQTLLRAHAPAGAGERLRRSVLTELAHRQTRTHNGKGSQMNGIATGTLTGPLAPVFPGARPAPGRPRAAVARPARWVGFYAGSALLLLVAGLLFYLLYQSTNNQVTPPPGPASPTTVPAPTTAPLEGWPMFGGNPARTRNMPGPGPEGEPVVLWTHSAADTGVVANVDRGSAADGVLYLPTSTGLIALDAATGQQLWLVEGYGVQAVVDGDGLIVYGNPLAATSDLVRLNRADGSVVWTTDAEINASWNPVIADGVGYVPSGSDLVAFDPATGDILWRVALNTTASRGAAVDGGLAVIGDEQGLLYGISTAGGDIVWTYQTDAVTIGHPSVANGVAYFTGIGGAEEAYYAVDTATGNVKWRYVVPGGTGFLNAAVGETLVYIPGQDGNLYAVEIATGALAWRFSTGAASVNSPALIGNTLYMVSNSGFAFAIDATTGAEIWRLPLDSGGDTASIVVDGVQYFSTVAGTVYAVGGTASGAVPAADASATPTASAGTGGSTGTTGAAALPTFAWATKGGDALKLVEPVAVEIAPDGTIWVADLPGRFLLFDADGNYLESWGEKGTGPGQFNFDAAYRGAFFSFAPDGSFYVSDLNNDRVQRFDKNRNFVGQWDGDGTPEGRFKGPGDIVILTDGTVLVADGERNDVQHFTADGVFLDRFDAAGTTDGPLVAPVGIAVDDQGRLIVAEIAMSRAHVFDAGGNQVAVLGAPGLEPPDFNSPFVVEVDAESNIYISDIGTGLIHVFGPDLAFNYEWGNTGQGDERRGSSGSMAIGDDGAVYVTDGVGLLQRFDLPDQAASGNAPGESTGGATAPDALVEFVWAASGDEQHELLRPSFAALDPFGRVWVTSTPGEFFIFDLDGNLLETWGAPGSGDEQFAFALNGVGEGGGILFTPDGGFYVADMGNARIQQFDRDRQFVRSWGTQGSGDGQFMAPAGLAFDAQGNVLITDFLRHDIQRFTPNGTFLDKFGGEGSEPGKFMFPAYLATAADGTIWVPDLGNHRVQVFNPDGTFKFTFGAFGEGGQGTMNEPAQVTFDGAGHVFVPNQYSNLVEVFDEQGRFLYQFGGQGSGDGQFTKSGGVAINRGDTVIVVDVENNRIQKFKITGEFPAPAEATPVA